MSDVERNLPHYTFTMSIELAPVVLAHKVGRSLAPAPPRPHTRHYHHRSLAMHRSLLATCGIVNESKFHPFFCCGVCTKENTSASKKDQQTPRDNSRETIRSHQTHLAKSARACQCSPQQASVLPFAGHPCLGLPAPTTTAAHYKSSTFQYGKTS